ncbi:hypothetical protein D3C76_1413210 [compost metagenome]
MHQRIMGGDTGADSEQRRVPGLAIAEDGVGGGGGFIEWWIWDDFFHVRFFRVKLTLSSVTTRMGGSCTRGGKPGRTLNPAGSKASRAQPP